MTKTTRWILTVSWVVVATLIWGVWEIIRKDVLNALLQNSYTSAVEAANYAGVFAFITTVVKFAVMFGPLYLIWTFRKNEAAANQTTVLTEKPKTTSIQANTTSPDIPAKEISDSRNNGKLTIAQTTRKLAELTAIAILCALAIAVFINFFWPTLFATPVTDQEPSLPHATTTASPENLSALRNQEFGFSLKYPTSWAVSPTTTPNSKAKVVSPANTPHAECAVIIQKNPQTAPITQSELDQFILTQPPSASELNAGLSQMFNDVEILSVSTGTLHNRPAYLSRTRFSTGTQYGKSYASGRTVGTITPGQTWTFSCGGTGKSVSEAENSYQYWQSAINNIVMSFQFQ